MEERQPIKMEEIPETEKSKRNIFYKIGLVCVLVILFLVKCGIKNPGAFNPVRSQICVYKASRIIKGTKMVDSVKVYPKLNRQVLPLLNKAIHLDENNWRAWGLKGTLYTMQWMRLDSAAMFLRKTMQLQEEQNATFSEKRSIQNMLCICLRRAHLPREALKEAMEGVKKFPKSKDMQKEVRHCVGQYYREVLNTGDTISEEGRFAQIQNCIHFADTLCQNNYWEEAVWVIRTSRDKYPEDEDLKYSLRRIGAEYADRLLANSEDTKEMWYLSKDIWNVDRKRALNLRRKCARLGDEHAQEWFKQKGYEWD